MVRGAHAGTEREAGGDGAADVGLGRPDRADHVVAQAEPAGDGRGQGAAGAVAVPVVRPRRRELSDRPVGPEQVVDGITLACPPLISTQAGPCASSVSASSAGVPDRPASSSASGRLGVITVATRSSSPRRAATASSSISASPCLLAQTGSTTTGTPAGRLLSNAATRRVVAAVPSIPVLTASTPMSSTTLRNWARTASSGSGHQPWTPTEFWAVTAVSTLIPCTPKASIVLRSAWMPAPPPESEPAMVSTRAVGRARVVAVTGRRRSGPSPPDPPRRRRRPAPRPPPPRRPPGSDRSRASPRAPPPRPAKLAASAWSSPPVSSSTYGSLPVAAATACSTSGTSKAAARGPP